MARGIKRREGEHLDAASIEKVIELLGADKPITKKHACELLNISYNTSRLSSIIDEYQERKAYAQERRRQLRGKPITEYEAKNIVEQYLDQTSLSELSESTHRSVNVIKALLSKYNLPIRSPENNYFNPVFIDDLGLAEYYPAGSLVYSARYNQPAEVVKVIQQSEVHGNIFQIWLFDDQMWASQPWYELANLTKVQQELGIKLTSMSQQEIRELIAEGLRNARKQNDK